MLSLTSLLAGTCLTDEADRTARVCHTSLACACMTGRTAGTCMSYKAGTGLYDRSHWLACVSNKASACLYDRPAAGTCMSCEAGTCLYDKRERVQDVYQEGQSIPVHMTFRNFQDPPSPWPQSTAW